MMTAQIQAQFCTLCRSWGSLYDYDDGGVGKNRPAAQVEYKGGKESFEKLTQAIVVTSLASLPLLGKV